MGGTHKELLKSLPAAVLPFQIEQQSQLVYRLYHFAQPNMEQQVMLMLTPETTRSIGAITLPVTTVKLEFWGFSKEDFNRFINRYKCYLHKGGG